MRKKKRDLEAGQAFFKKTKSIRHRGHYDITELPLNNMTLLDVEHLAMFAQNVVRSTGLNPREIRQLFKAMDVLGEDGEWHELSFGVEYTLEFGYETIKLIPSSFYIYENDKKTKLKEEYRIPTMKYDPLLDGPSKDDVEFPLYTGFYKALNGEEESIEFGEGFVENNTIW